MVPKELSQTTRDDQNVPQIMDAQPLTVTAISKPHRIDRKTDSPFEKANEDELDDKNDKDNIPPSLEQIHYILNVEKYEIRSNLDESKKVSETLDNKEENGVENEASNEPENIEIIDNLPEKSQIESAIEKLENCDQPRNSVEVEEVCLPHINSNLDFKTKQQTDVENGVKDAENSKSLEKEEQHSPEKQIEAVVPTQQNGGPKFTKLDMKDANSIRQITPPVDVTSKSAITQVTTNNIIQQENNIIR